MTYDPAKVEAFLAKLRADPAAALYVAAMINGATLAPSRCWGLFLSIGAMTPWEQANATWALRDIVQAHLHALALKATAAARKADDEEAGR